MGFRAGDQVRVASIDESWVLACDEENGRITCAGWPEGSVEAELCTLERAASDEERIKILEQVALSCRDQWRGRAARAQLAEERQWCCWAQFPAGNRGYIEAGAFAEDAAHSIARAVALLQGWTETMRITIAVEASYGHDAQRFEFDCRLVPEVTLRKREAVAQADEATHG